MSDNQNQYYISFPSLLKIDEHEGDFYVEFARFLDKLGKSWFNKAFDSLYHDKIWIALASQGV